MLARELQLALLQPVKPLLHTYVNWITSRKRSYAVRIPFVQDLVLRAIYYFLHIH